MTISEDQQDVGVYEVGYLVLPSITEENLPKLVSSIDEAVTAAGGKKIDGEDPEMEDLAYQMSKTVGARKYVVDEAYIGWTKFEAEPSRIAEVKTAIEKMDEVLRFLLIKAPRETTFSFAAARAKIAEAEKAKEDAAREVEIAAEEVVAPAVE